MGRGIVKNLMKNSYRVLIHDIDKEAVESLVNKGAVASPGLTDMAAEVDYLILSLHSPELVRKNISGGRCNRLDACWNEDYGYEY